MTEIALSRAERQKSLREVEAIVERCKAIARSFADGKIMCGADRSHLPMVIDPK